MRQAWLDAFGVDIAGCLTETNETIIHAFDCYACPPAQQHSYLVTSPANPVHFTLLNPTGQHLVFAAIDNCILGPTDQSRCDFAIGNFQKLLLVEVKHVNKAQRNTARRAAAQQLDLTLSLLRVRIDLRQTKLIAVICLQAKQAYPVFNARKSADRVRFLQEHGADLLEGQLADF